MWEQLFADRSWIGGTLTDDDAPTEPTEIVSMGFEERHGAQWVVIHGKDFDFAASRKYIGVGGPFPADGGLHFVVVGLGMGCTIRRKA